MAIAEDQHTPWTEALAENAARQLGALADWPLFIARVVHLTAVEIVLRRRYWRLIARHISDIVVGIGGWVLGGGMIFVLGFISFFVGAGLGLSSHVGLEIVGADNYVGVVASFTLVREMTPILCALALTTQVGSAFTAELGAMRISEEIDALDVMGVNSVTYLVCTRTVAAFFGLIPLYLLSLFASFFASMLVLVVMYGESPGTFEYYFQAYLPPMDVLYSGIKVAVFSVMVILVHCYYGFTATGGPVGVGVASGRAIRLSIILVILLNLLLSYVFWGSGGSVRFAA